MPLFPQPPASAWAILLEVKSTGPFAALAALLLPATLAAQSAAITLASTDLTIDPQNSDSFTVQGSFSGLSFDSSQTVTFSLGQFSGSIDLAGFVQQPNSNVFTYQDATGTAPAWLSSLTLDLDAKTFTASAANTALAGLPNPFAVQLGNESTSACVMARVQSTGATTYQLTAGDGAQEPCQMAAPQASPLSLLTGEATAVKFEVDIQPIANLNPATVQLFRADPNGQPAGPALCTLRDSGSPADGDAVAGDGAYGCIVHFNETNPGPIPLLVQANAGGNLLLAPGFYLLVAPPATQADIDNISAAADAASSAWDANFAAYGNTGQARAQTLASLRGLPGIADVRLLEDGLSIGIFFNCGLQHVLFLNRLGSGAQNAPSQAKPGAARATLATAPVPAAHARPALNPADVTITPKCNTPQRPAVFNNQVLIWESGFFPEPTAATLLDSLFRSVQCPQFQVKHVAATMAAASQFPNYGTVIVDSHGAVLGGNICFATSEPANLTANDPRWPLYRAGMIGGARVPGNPQTYLTLFDRYFATLGPYQRNIVFASTCSSAATRTMSNIMTSGGGAYYGFSIPIKGTTTVNDQTIAGFPERIAPELFNALLKQYLSAADAYQSVDHYPAPSEKLASASPHSRNVMPEGIVRVTNGPVFQLLNDSSNKLAYLGNPTILSPGKTSPFSIGMYSGTPMSLRAQIDGASSCQNMNFKWSNTANAGHLKPVGGGSGQDDFTAMSADTTYLPLIPPLQVTGFAPYPGVDNLMADFLPDPSNDQPAGRACADTNVIVPLFVFEQKAAAYLASKPEGIPSQTQFVPPKPVSRSYTVEDAGTYKGNGTYANATLTYNGNFDWTLTVTASAVNTGAGTNAMNQVYDSQVQIGLFAFNPPSAPGRSSHILVKGSFNTDFICSQRDGCSISDGSAQVIDSQHKATYISFRAEDKAANPFMVMADSSGSDGVSITLGVSCVGAHTDPSVYTAKIEIQFLNQ